MWYVSAYHAIIAPFWEVNFYSQVELKQKTGSMDPIILAAEREAGADAKLAKGETRYHHTISPASIQYREILFFVT